MAIYANSGNVLSSQYVNNDSMYVYSGGSARYTSVGSGGILQVSSGGSVYETTVFGGRMRVSSGGRGHYTTIRSNGNVWNYGYQSGTMVSSGGKLNVFGLENVLTVYSGGSTAVGSGGSLFDTDIQYKGTASILSGGTANYSYVDGELYVSSGGTAENPQIYDGGRLHVYGSAKKVRVSSGGYFVGYGSCYMSDVDIRSGVGYICGVGSDVSVDGGELYIESGGVVTSASVYNNGWLLVSSAGTLNSASLSSSGFAGVLSGGTAENPQIYDGGRLYVYGSAFRTSVWNGGMVTVSDGGVVESASIEGSMWIGSNAVASYVYVRSGGNVSAVQQGAVISLGWIFSGGKLMVGSGGSGNEIYVNGGTVNFENGGSGAVDIYSGGIVNVSSGGSTRYARVSQGAMTVFGEADNTSVFSGGVVNASSGGSLSNVTLFSSGSLKVLSGGIVRNLIYNGSAYASIYDKGMITKADIKSNGVMYVYSGGHSVSASLSSGGSMVVGTGGLASRTTIANGGLLKNYGGSVTYTDLLAGGVMTVESGVRLSNQNVRGTLIVSNGGVVSNCKPISGGVIDVLSGGSADDTKMMTNGRMYVSSNGIVTDTVTSYGAKIHVLGGSLYNTHMQRGTITSVYEGGVVSGTRVDYGSYLMIGFTDYTCSGVASAYDTVVSSGGGLTVMSGTVAEDSVINGTLNCNNYGKLTGDITIGTGRVNIAGNAIVGSDASLIFDVSERSASAMQESYREAMLNSYYVARKADMTISVSADQAEGSYILANWALEAKKGTFTLEVDGTEVGTFSTTKSLTYDGKTYSLYCFDDSTNSKALTLKVCDATSTDAWTDLGSGDFDGDGIEESLVSDGTNLYAASEDLWLGNLSGTEEITSIVDYNNDGTDDLLIHNTATDQMTAWLIKDGATYSTLAIA
ncbi:MAG: hypothetical protein IJW05_02760 [Lentisphaeria bacterium]|nr:hypothetical protein [Lentisphaeria bacterium]